MAAQRGVEPQTDVSVADNEAVSRFVRQLSVKLKAGLPLDKSLSALINETRNRRIQSVVWEIRKVVAKGVPLSRAMRRIRGMFDDCAINLVERGEANRKLGPMLASVADYLEHKVRLQASLRRAIARPLNALTLVLLATFVATVVLSFLAREALPMANAGQRAAISAADQIAVRVSDAVRLAWPYVGVLGLFCFIGLQLLPRLSSTRGWLDALALRLPLVGPTVHSASVAIFLRTLGIQMQAGTFMPEAMQMAARTAPNQAMRERILSTIQNIEDNRPYLEAMVADGFLHLGEVTSVQAAERRGEIGSVMLTLAGERDREAAVAAKKLTTLMDTLVVALLGLSITAVVLTLYVPVFIAH